MMLITVTEESWHELQRENAELQSRCEGLLQENERLRAELAKTRASLKDAIWMLDRLQ